MRAEGLPVAPGAVGTRERLRALEAEARALGVTGARLQGLAARARPHGEEVAHAAAALGAFGVGLCGVEWAVLGLLGLLAAGLLRTRDVSLLTWMVPRSPCWNLVLRRPGARTTRVLVAAADASRPAPWLPWSLAVADVAAIGALFAGPLAAACTAGAIALLGALAWVWGRPAPPAPDSPEAAAARSVLREAARLSAAGDEEVAVVLSGCAAEAGEGIDAFCDWWGLSRARVEIVAVGLPGTAARALARAGWTVRQGAA